MKKLALVICFIFQTVFLFSAGYQKITLNDLNNFGDEYLNKKVSIIVFIDQVYSANNNPGYYAFLISNEFNSETGFNIMYNDAKDSVYYNDFNIVTHGFALIKKGKTNSSELKKYVNNGTLYKLDGIVKMTKFRPPFRDKIIDRPGLIIDKISKYKSVN